MKPLVGVHSIDRVYFAEDGDSQSVACVLGWSGCNGILVWKWSIGMSERLDVHDYVLLAMGPPSGRAGKGESGCSSGVDTSLLCKPYLVLGKMGTNHHPHPSLTGGRQVSQVSKIPPAGW